MRRVCLYFLFIVVSAFSPACSSPEPAAQPPSETSDAVLFEGARLIVGDGSTVEDSAFIVEDNKFTQVGRKGEIQLPAGATRVDLAGKTVMPAIVNGHVHIGLDDLAKGGSQWENYNHDHLVEELQRYAYFGVSAVNNMGNDGEHGELPYQLREEDIPNGARYLTTGPGMAGPGNGQMGIREKTWTTLKSPEDARKAVQALAPRKPTMIKTWVDDRVNEVEPTRPEVYQAMFDEAHKLGMQVGAHFSRLAVGKAMAKAGLDGFVHTPRDIESDPKSTILVDDEFIKILQARQPRMFYMAALRDPPERMGGYTEEELTNWIADVLPPARIQAMREGLLKQKTNPQDAKVWTALATNFERMHKCDCLRIGMGGDGSQPWASHTELWDMVKAGMTPMESITAGTKTTAEILRVDDMGSVATGKSADFIVLDANPLDDIKNTRQINKVYLRGSEIDRAGLKAKFTAGS